MLTRIESCGVICILYETVQWFLCSWFLRASHLLIWPENSLMLMYNCACLDKPFSLLS